MKNNTPTAPGINPMRSQPHMKRGLNCLCKVIPDNLVGIEIGSYAGESALILAASGRFSKLLCIDPWEPNYYRNQQQIFAEKEFDKVAAKFSELIVKIKGYSDQQLAYLTGLYHGPHNPFGFIYIDGNHQYDQVKKDIQASLQLLPEGSILAGHDYGFAKAPGVKMAVDEIFGYPDAVFCDTTWVKWL
jgi:predicted O-methyltransferase YrrM